MNDNTSRLGSGHLLTDLRESVSDVVLLDLAQTVTEVRLLAGHMLYDPEVSILVAGLIRAFISDPTGRQPTVAYIRPGQTLALAHLAGRRYPTAFQAIDDSQLLVIGTTEQPSYKGPIPNSGGPPHGNSVCVWTNWKPSWRAWRLARYASDWPPTCWA